MTNTELATWLHDNYEGLAKAFKWETQKDTRVPFEELPKRNQCTMLALADRMNNTFLIIARQADVRRSADMITEQFEYRGFTFQRMTKDARWYVCYANQIVNWGQYQNDLKEWVDGHYA